MSQRRGCRRGVPCASEHDRERDAGDGRHDGGDDGRAAHRTILEALRDAVGNPCTARYVDPVRVGSLLPGLVYPGSGRWYAASSPPGCSRSRSPRPLLPSPASSGPASRSIPASSSRRTAPSRSTSSRGPRPGGTTTLAPSLSNDTLTGTGDADRDRAAHRAAGDDRRHQRRLLRVRDGRAERRPHAGRAGDEPAVRLSRERRRHLRRHARRPPGHALRHLAGRSAASAP